MVNYVAFGNNKNHGPQLIKSDLFLANMHENIIYFHISYVRVVSLIGSYLDNFAVKDKNKGDYFYFVF